MPNVPHRWILLILLAPVWAWAQSPVELGPHVRLHPGGTPRNWVRTALLWGIDDWFYSVSAERAVSNQVAYGIKWEKFDVFNQHPEIAGQGVMAVRSFFSAPSFSGATAQVALGPYFFHSPQNGTQAMSFIVDFNAGWRFQLLRWLGWGFQFSLRYIHRPDLQGVDLSSYRSVRGTIGTEIGIRF